GRLPSGRADVAALWRAIRFGSRSIRRHRRPHPPRGRGVDGRVAGELSLRRLGGEDSAGAGADHRGPVDVVVSRRLKRPVVTVTRDEEQLLALATPIHPPCNRARYWFIAVRKAEFSRLNASPTPFRSGRSRW